MVRGKGTFLSEMGTTRECVLTHDVLGIPVRTLLSRLELQNNWDKKIQTVTVKGAFSEWLVSDLLNDADFAEDKKKIFQWLHHRDLRRVARLAIASYFQQT